MRTTGKGFKMRSGNKPSGFKMMGSSPITKMSSFGIGEGTSPLNIVPVNNPSSSDPYADAKKKDPDLDKHIAERKKHKAGSKEYEAAQAKINSAYGTVRDQDLKAAQIKNAGEEETKEDTEVSTDNDASSIMENAGNDSGGGKSSLMGKIGREAKGALGAAFQGLTHGLDAVYGTGKVNIGNNVTFSEPKKKKDEKTGQDKVNEQTS
jgi:hypothetical protein